MMVGNAIKKQIVASPDAVELRKLAIKNGMIALLGHGAQLVKEGITTVTEILRVSKGIEEVE